jgi:hypothetical protein
VWLERFFIEQVEGQKNAYRSVFNAQQQKLVLFVEELRIIIGI